VDISGGIQASLAGRYASALFDLARDDKAIGAVEASLSTVASAIAQSDDFRRLVGSPLVSRKAAVGAVAAVASELALDPTTTRFVGVLAQNRRLNQLPQVIAAFRAMAARYRGEVAATVTSAHPLSDEQIAALKAKLKARTGKDVALATTIDPAILSGLVVRIGSQMIDSSIRTRLNSLAHAMKG